MRSELRWLDADSVSIGVQGIRYADGTDGWLELAVRCGDPSGRRTVLMSMRAEPDVAVSLAAMLRFMAGRTPAEAEDDIGYEVGYRDMLLHVRPVVLGDCLAVMSGDAEKGDVAVRLTMEMDANMVKGDGTWNGALLQALLKPDEAVRLAELIETVCGEASR